MNHENCSDDWEVKKPGDVLIAGHPRGNGHPEFYTILEELADLHSHKNSDYANRDPLSNLKMCELGGIPGWKGVIVRLTDKISRLLTFCEKESYQVKDESVEDTLKDTAVYAILGLILYREREGKRSEIA